MKTEPEVELEDRGDTVDIVEKSRVARQVGHSLLVEQVSGEDTAMDFVPHTEGGWIGYISLFPMR